jgi:hypothetical protein
VPAVLRAGGRRDREHLHLARYVMPANRDNVVSVTANYPWPAFKKKAVSLRRAGLHSEAQAAAEDWDPRPAAGRSAHPSPREGRSPIAAQGTSYPAGAHCKLREGWKPKGPRRSAARFTTARSASSDAPDME